MTDKRWDVLADRLINKSLMIKPQEKLMIMVQEIDSYPLALACYRECIKAGGYCQIQFMSEAIKHQILKYGNDDQINWIPEIEAYGMEWADCYLGLKGAFNLNECFDISDEKLAKYQKAMGVVSSKRCENTRWTLVRVPNERFAQQANVSYDKMMDMFFNACNVNWNEEGLLNLKKHLAQGKHYHIVSDNTDLEMDVYGSSWTIENGGINVPEGEIYASPVWNTVNGYISFEYPATLGGKVIHNLRLDFKDGLVVNVQGDENVDYVNKILDSDENARRVGEIAFGTNPAIVDVVTTDILIDEKIPDSMHIAVGRNIVHDENYYYSAIHWDIVKDMRTNSKVYIDDELVYENGKFLYDDCKLVK